MSNRSVVIYGPRGCGKSRHATQLLNHFDLERVVDNWDGLSDVPQVGALILTSNAEANVPLNMPRMHFGAAIRELSSEA